MKLSRPFALALLSAGAAMAQVPAFQLSIPDNANLPVSPGQEVPVQVTYILDTPAATGFQILGVSLFAPDAQGSGGPAAVEVLKACGDKTPLAFPAAFDLKDQVASFCLRMPALGGDAKYSGSITLHSLTGAPATNRVDKHTFSISRPVPPPATLVTDRQSLVVQLDRPFLFDSFDPNIARVALIEKSGKGRASGIAVSGDSGAKGPGSFDPGANLAFLWNENSWDTPFSSPPPPSPGQSDARAIDPGRQASITILGKGLRPGEYTVPLHFSAAGASSDNAKISLTVDVRDSIWWAVIVLLLALLLSFITTKMLTGKQRRAKLLQQIRDLRLSKGTTLPRLPAVVWMDSVLRLTEELSSRFWLSGADLIDAQIDSVRPTAAILKQARELLADLQLRLHPLVFQRASDAVNRVIFELGTEPPDDTLVNRVKTDLAVFNDWLQAGTYPAALWKIIMPALESLKRDIEAGAPPDATRTAIDNLKKKLDDDLKTPPAAAEDVESSYHNYARLRILWDCQSDDETFQKLIVQPPLKLEECFRLNDALAWKQLKDNKDSLRIQAPDTTDEDGLEAFRPLGFSVTADDHRITSSYVFRHKVEFFWTFTMLNEESDRTDGPHKFPSLNPTTLGPSVVQYFPRPCYLKIKASLHYGSDSIDVPEITGPPIQDSGDFGVLQAFAGVEYISWGLAAAVALATGLATYYFKNQTFGSFQDYLTLALWGAGMDQGKNFLQALQATQPPK